MSEYEPVDRNNVLFGMGSYIGQIAQDPNFFKLPVRDQARLAGWADGCPVVEELTDPGNLTPGRGPETMLNRYGEVNFWFGQILREVNDNNFELWLRLRSPVIRLQSEPVGKYETESVPDNYERVIAPMGTLWGYALPRMFVEQLKPAGADSAGAAERMAKGLAVVRKASVEARLPADFMAMVAEGLAGADADPMKLLKHMVGKGWMSEHNSDSMLDCAKRSLEDHAKQLWAIYDDLTPEQKTEYGLV